MLCFFNLTSVKKRPIQHAAVHVFNFFPTMFLLSVSNVNNHLPTAKNTVYSRFFIYIF